jgi:uncharacterized protein YkwD
MASTSFDQPTGPFVPLRPRATVHIRNRRRLLASAVVLILAVLVIVVPATLFRARALSSTASDFVNRINNVRTSRGLAPLVVDGNLTALAEQHSLDMANSGRLVHSGSLSAGVALPWAKLGENIGMGSNTDLVWGAFLSSPVHFGNIVNPSYTHIGLGVVVDANGNQWTTQRFLQLSGSLVASAPDPAPAAPPVTAAPRRSAPPTTAPAPVHVAPPTTEPPPPPPPVEPPPADPTRVRGLLDALGAAGTSTQKPDAAEGRSSSVLSALRSR